LQIQRGLRGRALAGIVLLSDGNDTTSRMTGDDSAQSTAGADEQSEDAALEQLHVPVHAVEVAPVGSAADLPPRVSLQSVTAPRRALVNNIVRVAVDIAAEGSAAGHAVPVAILLGGRPVAARMVALSPSEPVTRAEIELVPAVPGRFTYLVQVGNAPGQTMLEHNRATFALTVRARPLTVLYIDGVLRPEGKFVREALTSDPDLNLVTAIRTAPPGAGRGSPGLLLQEQLANIDVVILGDMEASYFSAQEIASLRRWVTEDGGGLLLTGGYLSFGAQGLVRTDLRDILPVEFSAQPNPQIEQAFNLKLTEAGRQSPIFHLGGDKTIDTRFYQTLPKLEGCARIAAVKPGAEVLAVNPTVEAGEGSTGLPVMVTQQVGAGRAMVFSVDTTWHWRMIVGGFTGDASFYQRFWGQIVRWLASSDEESAGAQLHLSTDRYRYPLGQNVELRVSIDPPAAPGARGKPGEEAWRLKAWALPEAGGAAIPVVLTPGRDNQYQATLPADKPGRMDLTVIAEPLHDAAGAGSATGSGRQARAGDTQVLPQSQVITVQVDRPDLETADTRANPQWLARAAQLTGGQVLSPKQIPAWAAQLPREPAMVRYYEATELWRHPALIGIFLCLLCVEWIWRRVSRLA
jgi:uncharacterized membrane protein